MAIGPLHNGGRPAFNHTPRTPSSVTEDLRARNFQPANRRCIAALIGISPQKYRALMGILTDVGRHHPPHVKLRLPNHAVLEAVEFENVPARHFDDFVSGQKLDLRHPERIVAYARGQKERDGIWADEESTPKPRLLGEIERGRVQIEEVAVGGMEEPNREVPTPLDVEQQFYQLMQRKSPLLRFGQTITVGTIKSPASGLTKPEQKLVVDALNFTARDREDMYDHLIPVAEVVVVFHQRNPIAFGACNEINFQNNGTAERLEYLVATQVRKGFYGRGLQTVVNGIYSMQREGVPMSMMRSRSVGTIDGFRRHFSGVSFRLDTPAKMRRAHEFARFMGCECDETGIVRNAYETPPHDPERDQQILEALKRNHPKRYNWVMTALEGLGPRDARIFQGRLTRWDKLRFKFDIDVRFRLGARKKEKEDNAEHS